jgi:hypothetical protein
MRELPKDLRYGLRILALATGLLAALRTMTIDPPVPLRYE